MPDGSVVTLSCMFIQFVDTNTSTKQRTKMDMDIGPRIWIGLWMDQAAGREVSKQNFRYGSLWSDVRFIYPHREYTQEKQPEYEYIGNQTNQGM